MIVVLATVLAITLVLAFLWLALWRSQRNIRPFMGLEIYVDGKHAASLESASGWDAAARWIEKHTAPRTPLRRLAELGETYQPEQASAMLADLLEHQKPAPNIEHTLRDLCHFLTGDHVLITDGPIDEP